MRKTLLFVLVFFCLTSIISAEQWEIKSKYIDLTPNDGFMDAGSTFNPLVIESQSGQIEAEIKPKYIDITPNDGFMDSGSQFNPMVIDWK